MAVQTAVDQAVAQAAQDTTLETTRPGRPEQGINPTEVMTARETEAAQTARAAVAITQSTVMFMATVALAAAALFGLGLIRSRARPILDRMVVRAEEIRVPLLLPLTLAEVAREIIADQRAIDSGVAGRHAAS